jgi:hypothetical protein
MTEIAGEFSYPWNILKKSKALRLQKLVLDRIGSMIDRFVLKDRDRIEP